MIVDIGDIFINIYSFIKIVDIIYKYIAVIVEFGCKSLVLGGDYIIIYLILKGIKVCFVLYIIIIYYF